MKRILALLTLTAFIGLGIAGCDSADATLEGRVNQDSPAPASDHESATAKSDAPVPVFYQGFNHGVEPWVGNETDGPFGWCGTIERVERLDKPNLQPSAGRAFATVENGLCNDFWTTAGFPSSAPASGPDPDLLSTTWPVGGFVQQLDVYLDPAMFSSGQGFVYANSLCVLTDEGTCFPEDLSTGAPQFNYFAIQVTKENGDLLVNGHDINKPGWYTFRHVFGSSAGKLTVDFELLKNGRPLQTSPITSTLLSGQDTSEFGVADLGSGYVWFVSIADGVELPIDEHLVRRGQ
jgi:hypothetical protein